MQNPKEIVHWFLKFKASRDNTLAASELCYEIAIRLRRDWVCFKRNGPQMDFAEMFRRAAEHLQRSHLGERYGYHNSPLETWQRKAVLPSRPKR